MKNFSKVSVASEARTELHDQLGLTGAEVSLNHVQILFIFRVRTDRQAVKYIMAVIPFSKICGNHVGGNRLSKTAGSLVIQIYLLLCPVPMQKSLVFSPGPTMGISSPSKPVLSTK